MTEVIEIKRGDTLSGLARTHNTTVGQLAQSNGIKNPDRIIAGHPLIVPSQPAPKAPAASADAVEEGEASAKEKEDKPPKETCAECEDKEKKKKNKDRARWRVGGDDNTDVIYADARGKAGDGKFEGSVGAGLVKMQHEGHFGESPFGGSHSLEMMNAEASVQGGGGYGGGGVRAKAATRMVKEGATVFAGSDMNNPLVEAGGEYELLTAEAKGDVLLGSDGRRRGLALGGGATAAAAKADAKGSFSIPIPFTNWTIGVAGKGGGSAGSVGLAGGAHAFQDVETGRVHMGAGGEVAALLGVKFDLDLSIGPKYTDRKRPHGP